MNSFKLTKEYKKIIQKEKLKIGSFSYDIYLGSDILFEKDEKAKVWNFKLYKRIQGTTIERLMIILAFGSIKRKENKWNIDETTPFHIIGPQIQKTFKLNNQKSEEIAEEVLCDSKNSFLHMFEIDFLLEKGYLSINDVLKIAEYYQSISIASSMLFQFLTTISVLKKYQADVSKFNEKLISLRKYELLQIIDISSDILKNNTRKFKECL